jgi:RNA polymerase sigma factor (sigma-70 family)
MSLLTIPSELSGLLATPGRDWTAVDRLRVVVWLNRPASRDVLLRFAAFRLGQGYRTATFSDAEDVWSAFSVDRLGAVMRLFDPAEGTFVRFLFFTFGRECARTALRLRQRMARSTAEVEAVAIPARVDSPERAAERKETAHWLQTGIEALPASDREVIVQHYFENKELREIALALGVSVATAKVRLFRARRRLATLLPAASL